MSGAAVVPALCARLLHEVMERMASGMLRPVQWRTFPVSQVSDAFREMARDQHVGKLVVTMNDAQLRVVPPPEMVANLRADNIDGFLAPDNICQRAIYDGVGFLHILSKEIWDGHPCCSFAVSRAFMSAAPNSTVLAIEILPASSGITEGDSSMGSSGTAGATGSAGGSSGSSQSYRVTVRMDDGSTQVVTHNTTPDFRSGDRVNVTGGSIQR